MPNYTPSPSNTKVESPLRQVRLWAFPIYVESDHGASESRLRPSMFLLGVIADQIFQFWGMVPDWPCSVADFSICHTNF